MAADGADSIQRSRVRARRAGATLLRASVAIAALSIAATWLLAGCGLSSNTDLPDLASKKEPLPSGRQPLSTAEQKQAIDAMIAKRDAQNQAK